MKNTTNIIASLTKEDKENEEDKEVQEENTEEEWNSKPLNQAIRIYARIRPTRTTTKSWNSHSNANAFLPLASCNISIDQPTPGDQGEPQLHFTIPKNESQGWINNTKEHFGFRFDRVFNEQTTQEEIFDYVAKESIDSVMQGYNATIFAYGQTGSGKTFTITGGAERYVDRGLIPRTIQYLFKQIKDNPSRNYQVFVSYLEIYNEVGYDLLDESRDVKKLEDLPKVSLREDEDQRIYIQNLSLRPVVNEEETLNWLFVGDTNKMISETPSNPSSSRSHCLFMLTLLSQTNTSDTLLRSKFHLVDLAGSERVSKTGIDGTLLKEAKYINLSLHYLEQVIVALHEKAIGKRTHIPYRNSMMTSILRDSLGGNCRTSMIATLATEPHLLDESISTCRFAQRVALISNRVSINEELDPHVLIAKLKKQISELKAELALARGGSYSEEPLPEYELKKCRHLIHTYLELNQPMDPMVVSDYRKVMYCFQVLKELYFNHQTTMTTTTSPRPASSSSFIPTSPSSPTTVSTPSFTALQDEVKHLKKLIHQRDTEISVLIPMVNKYKSKAKHLETLLSSSSSSSSSSSYSTWVSSSCPSLVSPTHPRPPSSLSSSDTTIVESTSSVSTSLSTNMTTAETDFPSFSNLVDRSQLLEAFKKQYPPMSVIEEQKEILKLKYMEAKKLGNEASEARNQIKHLKEQLSQTRTSYESLSLSNPTLALPTEFVQEEQELRKEITLLTEKYKKNYASLKSLKVEIEHMQHLLEMAKMKLNVDFDAWLTQLSSSSFSSPPASSSLSSFTPSSAHSSSPTSLTSFMDSMTTSKLNKTSTSNFTNISTPSLNSNSKIKNTQVLSDIQAFYAARDKLSS